MTKEQRQVQIRSWLQNEFSRRSRLNPRFSIRSFAKRLDVDSSSLSQILSGTRQVSDKIVFRFANKIGASPLTSPQESTSVDYQRLSEDMFTAISDWHHFAILDLTLIKNFKSDPAWIAKKLDISVQQ